MIRFVPWSEVGSISVSPGDNVVEVGSFELAEGADTLWVRMTNTGTPGPWPWSYGILSFKTEEGQPLGSIKAYNSYEGEVFRLGVGLAPSVRSGVLTFEPRGFNMAWIKQGNPWSLKFEAQSGNTGAVMEGFWNRDADNALLTPKFGNDTVEAGDTRLSGALVSAGFPSGSQGPGCCMQNIGGVYSYRALGSNVPVFQGGEAPISGQSGTAIQLWSQGNADFAGRVTASNVVFRKSDQIYWTTSENGESSYTGPELDLLSEIERLEALVSDLYEKLRLIPPAGWEVWDGSDFF
jgi:hypothetical protein